MTTKNQIDPFGATAEAAATDRFARSERYRAQHDRLAPYRAIATAVILARADKGWTQNRLAEAIGTTGTAISRVESGRHPISLETLTKLGSALDIAFVVGSASATQHLARDKGCVVIPEAAIEKPAARPVNARHVARRAPPHGHAGAAASGLIAAGEAIGGTRS
jgi:transcriptional regulator with XRE-family HTH domain